jgi:hypothetical protein
MVDLENLFSEMIKDPEESARLSTFIETADLDDGIVLGRHFPNFRATLSKVGFSNDHAVATLQIGVLNYFIVNSSWGYADNEGPFSEQVDAILGFLSNDLSKSAEHFHKFPDTKWKSIFVEYYFRLLAVSPGNSATVETMRAIGYNIELSPSNLGVFLLPATLSATLSQFDLANSLLQHPYSQVIKPNLTTYYPKAARYEKSSERLSYKTDDEQTQVFLKYFKEMRRFKSPFQNDSMMINYVFAVEIMKYLKTTKVPIKTLLNFGSTYGWLEFNVHRNFRDLKVIGYDESKISKELNENTFPAEQNLQFTWGEFWESVEKIDKDQTMLLHCRTGTLLEFGYLTEFYKELAKNEFPVIGIAEHFRFNMTDGRFLDQNADDFSSEVKTGTGVTRLHNYKKALSAAGYRIVVEKMVPDVSYRGRNVLALGEYVYVAIAEPTER